MKLLTKLKTDCVLDVSTLKMVTRRKNIWKFLKILPSVKPLLKQKSFAPSLEMTFAFHTNWLGINEPKFQDGTTQEMNKSIFLMLTDVKKYIWILIWSIYFILIAKIGKVLKFISLIFSPPIMYFVPGWPSNTRRLLLYMLIHLVNNFLSYILSSIQLLNKDYPIIYFNDTWLKLVTHLSTGISSELTILYLR